MQCPRIPSWFANQIAEPTWVRYASIAPQETTSPTVFVYARVRGWEGGFYHAVPSRFIEHLAAFRLVQVDLANRVAFKYAIRVPISRASLGSLSRFLLSLYVQEVHVHVAALSRSHPHIIRPPTPRITKSRAKRHRQWRLRNTDGKDWRTTDIECSRFLVPLKISILCWENIFKNEQLKFKLNWNKI